MSKDQKIEPQDRPGIIHLLEYCRIDRAAELLGCKVCDLLHLEEICKISLYWNLNGQPATTKLRWIERCSEESAEDMADELPMGLHAYALPVEAGGISEETVPDRDIPIRLFGLWDAGDRHSYASRFYKSEESFMLCFGSSTAGTKMMAALPVQWDEPPSNELCIMQHDFLRLREAIDTGKPLDEQSSGDERSGHQRTATITEQYRVFETKNTCAAIVQLLQALGFTPEELGKTSNGLQQKITARGISEILASGITEKTLREWMKIGGAR